MILEVVSNLNVSMILSNPCWIICTKLGIYFLLMLCFAFCWGQSNSCCFPKCNPKSIWAHISPGFTTLLILGCVSALWCISVGRTVVPGTSTTPLLGKPSWREKSTTFHVALQISTSASRTRCCAEVGSAWTQMAALNVSARLDTSWLLKGTFV